MDCHSWYWSYVSRIINIYDFCIIMNDIEKYQAIEEIFDKQLRPYLQGDGGDVELVLVEGDKVVITYKGACGSCPSSAGGTLRGIERSLRQQVDPNIVVVPTNAYEAPRFGQEHPFGGLTYEQQIEARRKHGNNNY